MSRVLIVEDDISIAELERDYLELSDFEVDLAADGVQGLAMLQEKAYDLFILDLMLPGLDGFELCKKNTGKAGCAYFIGHGQEGRYRQDPGLGHGGG